MKEKHTTIRIHMNPKDAVETWLHALDKDFRNKEKHVLKNGTFEIWYKKEVYDAYAEIFGESLEKYNAGVSRPCRQIKDESGDFVAGYLQQILNSKRGKRTREVTKKTDDGQKVVIGEKKDNGARLVYEFVISAGNCNKLFNDRGQVLYDRTGHEVHPLRMPVEVNKAAMRRFFEEFEDKYDHFKICYTSYHEDEFYKNDLGVTEKGIEHVHMGVIPVSDGYKRGMDKQASITKALSQMGCVDGRDDTGAYHNAYWYICDRMQKDFETILQDEYNKWLRDKGKAPELLVIEHPARGKNRPNMSPQQFREVKDMESKKRQLDVIVADIEEKEKDIESLTDELEMVRRDTMSAKEQKEKVVRDCEAEEQHARENLSIAIQTAEREMDETMCRLAAEELYTKEEQADAYDTLLTDLNRCMQSVKEVHRDVAEYIRDAKSSLDEDISIDIVAKDQNIRAWMECQKTSRNGREMNYLEAYKYDVAEAVRLDKKREFEQMQREQKKKAEATAKRITEAEKRIRREKRMRELDRINPVAEYFNKYGEDYQR